MTRTLTKPQENGVDSFIQQAISSNLPIETMEKLLALRDSEKAKWAKEQYVRAISSFQGSCPVIEKSKIVKNKDNSIRYKYAPLDSIVSQVKGLLKDNGLSYTINSGVKDGMLNATVTITHIDGHGESSSFEIPIDKEGFMTAPQKYASAQTFAKRYAFCNALGILTGEEDTDATDVEVKEAGPVNQKAKIMFLLKELNYETADKSVIEETVKKITNLKLIDKNLDAIVERLEILVKESYEDKSISE